MSIDSVNRYDLPLSTILIVVAFLAALRRRQSGALQALPAQ